MKLFKTVTTNDINKYNTFLQCTLITLVIIIVGVGLTGILALMIGKGLMNVVIVTTCFIIGEFICEKW
jgi:hypothetical protein